MALDDDEVATFYVSAAYSPDAADDSIGHYEHTIERAAARFENLERQYPCVWLSEYGVYRLSINEQRVDWIYFRWTKAAAAVWGPYP